MIGRTNQAMVSLARVIGIDRNPLSIITSALFSLILLFYAYSIASYLKLIIYPFANRVIYYKFFDSYILGQFNDNLVIIFATTVWLAFSLERKPKFFVPLAYCVLMAILIAIRYPILLDTAVLLSVPTLVFLTIYNRFVRQKRLKILNSDSNSLLINYLSTTGTVIGIIGLIISSAPLFSISTPLIQVRNYEYDLFLLLSSFSAILLIVLLGCVPVKIFMNKFMAALLRIKHIRNTPSVVRNDDDNNKPIKLTSKIIFVSLFMLFSIVIGLIPHQPQVNLENQQIGVDTDYYVKWINALTHAIDYREFIHQAFVVQSFGNEPLTLIFMFTIAEIAHGVDLDFLVEHMPLIFGPLLVLVVFFFTRELTSSDRQALLASFLTSVSFQVLIGIYAGFYANWFALIIGYLSFLYLIRFLKYSNNKRNLALFSVLLIALMFTHIHTWSVLVVVMGLFTIIMFKLKLYCTRRIVLLFLVLSSSVVLDIIRTSMTGSASAIEKDLDFAKSTASGLEQFTTRWSNLTRSVYSFVGGQFSNFIIFSLGVYWLFQSNTRHISSIFLMIFMSIGLVISFW